MAGDLKNSKVIYRNLKEILNEFKENLIAIHK